MGGETWRPWLKNGGSGGRKIPVARCWPWFILAEKWQPKKYTMPAFSSSDIILSPNSQRRTRTYYHTFSDFFFFPSLCVFSSGKFFSSTVWNWDWNMAHGEPLWPFYACDIFLATEITGIFGTVASEGKTLIKNSSATIALFCCTFQTIHTFLPRITRCLILR